MTIIISHCAMCTQLPKQYCVPNSYLPDLLMDVYTSVDSKAIHCPHIILYNIIWGQWVAVSQVSGLLYSQSKRDCSIHTNVCYSHAYFDPRTLPQIIR